MNATTKILIGALVTALFAWWLYGPMGFGERCAASANAPAAIAPPAPAPAAEVPATAEAVSNCQTKVDATIQGRTINFASGGTAIAPESIALIDALATDLKACAGTVVEVAGHTDSTGGGAANMRLSEERANSVVAALVERGIPTERFMPKGFGETAPLDPAQSETAYAKNRRIEFKVATAAAPAAAAQ